MKYIDADKLREAVEGTTWYHISNGRLVEGANSQDHEPLYKASAIYKVLDNADVVEVVRCGECIHWNAETKGCKRNPCVYRWYAKDFCSYGVR